MTARLTLTGIGKSFGDRVVLDGVSLAVQEGEILVLLGPSGSGKTTLLRLIAGFESPDAGRLDLGGEDISGVPPARRNFGMVFQHYALFPHLSVGRNVAFGLEGRGLSAEERRSRVAEVLEIVDLAGFEERRVHQISGGQQQRVALARALAPRPRLLLLDEPLSNLDPDLRERTRRELVRAVARVGLTAVWVTHEQEEAFDVGDRVAVLHDGRLDQVGAPEELYLEPATRFVAGFVGRASFLRGRVADHGRVLLGDERSVGASARWPAGNAADFSPGTEVDVLVRPEGLQLTRPGSQGTLAGTVTGRRYAGETIYYVVEVEHGGPALVAAAPAAPRPGERVGVGLREDGPAPRLFARSAGAAP